MEIKACPNCGSKRIYQGRMGDGVLTGYVNRDVCRDCGYQGMHIIFDSEKEYKKFLESKKST
jgi:DNA-directed RNA polymerase subunit RPC12/RpoP